MTASLQALPGLLLPWYAAHQRDLPWRRDQEPYHVWLSEIMLQQTRVEAVIEYYTRFLTALPDIAALAACPEEQLLKLWQGLGYYRRVRNLQSAAREIMSQYGGQFPRDPALIRLLPGIGEYTTGAIASICFGLPVPAVDGNVLRVLSRVLADETPLDKPALKRRITAELMAVYPVEAGDFCQSLMELGATVCLPNGAPLCAACPLREICQARAQDRIAELPVKAAKKARKQERMTVFLLYSGERLALRKRPERGLLAGLWELPHQPGWLAEEEILAALQSWGLTALTIEALPPNQHIFTHVEWQMQVYRLECATEASMLTWVTPQQLQEVYALPTAFGKLLPKAT